MSAGAEHCAIYRGVVRHRRLADAPHAFTARMLLAYLDLDEIESAFRGSVLRSDRRPAPIRFRRADYLGPPELPLRDAVAERVAARLGRRPEGPIRMLAMLRTWGFCFNPVAFYYCLDADGAGLDAVVAEITNTPWGERHAYVFDARAAGEAGHCALRWRFPKAFHVSPFLPMDLEYDWRLTAPGRRLGARMTLRRDGATVFESAMSLRREPFTSGALLRAHGALPWATGGAIARIYLEALRLRLKGATFHPHPDPHPRRAEEATA